jgi:ubiquitin
MTPARKGLHRKEPIMKATIIVAAAAAGLTLVGISGAARAQTATIAEPTVTVGSTEPTPESPAIARKEAGAALAQARQDCRKENDRQAQKTCLSAARDDYDQMMAAASSTR